MIYRKRKETTDRHRTNHRMPLYRYHRNQNYLRKKIIFVLLLVSLVIINQTVLFANDEILISHDEAVELIQTASDIRMSLGMYFQWFSGSSTPGYFNNIPQSDIAYKNPEYRGMLYLKVKSGYDPDSVKNLIKNTFDLNYSSKIIKMATEWDFFEKYYLENNEWYYFHYRADSPDSYVDGYRPNYYFDEEDICNLIIVESSSQFAKLAVKFKYYNETEYEQEYEQGQNEDIAYFDVEYIDNRWKIVGMDFRNMIFHAKTDDLDDENLTYAYIRESAVAVISDLFSMTICNNNYHMETYGSQTIRNKSTIPQNEIKMFEGNLSEFSVWREYALRYCTDDVAKYFLGTGNDLLADGSICKSKVVVIDDIVYLRYPSTSGFHTPLDRQIYYISENDIKNAEIEIISQDSSHATVRFDIGSKFFLKQNDVATIEVQYLKTEEGWRISSYDFVYELMNDHFNPYAFNGAIHTADNGMIAFSVLACALAVEALRYFIKRKKANI